MATTTSAADAERAIERWLAAPYPSPLEDWAVEWPAPPPGSGAPRVAGRVILSPMPGESETNELDAEPTAYGVVMCRFLAEPVPGQRVAVPST